MRLLIAIASCALALSLGAGPAAADAGELDLGYGSGGVARQSFGLMGDLISGIALLPDGRVVAGGSMSDDSGELGFGVARFTTTGALDATFGTGGFSRLGIPTKTLLAQAFLRQQDGKFVIGGNSLEGMSQTPYLARFDANGLLDTAGFSNPQGWVSRDWGGDHSLESLSQFADGALLATGVANQGFAMDSLQSDGLPNFVFNGPPLSPTKTVQLTGAFDGSAASVVLPDGRFVLAGIASGQFAVARFLPNGTLDPSFATGAGFTVVPPPTGDTARINAVLLLPDNSIVAAGFSGVGPASDSMLLKFTPSGALDPSFGIGGISSIGIPDQDAPRAIAVAPDGKFVVAGSANNSAAENIVVTRTLANGAPDSTFGVGGRTITDLGGDDEGSAVVVRPDLDVVVGGSSAIQGVQSHDFVLLEYQGSNAPTPLIPVSRITSPSRASLKRKRFKRFAGTAGPAGLVSKVELAVRRINKQQLRKKRCLWLSSSRAKFKKVRSSARKKCTTQHWIRAKGTTKWSYALKRTLPPGRYEIYARATLTDGQTQTTFTATAGNFRKLKLTNK